MPADIKSADAVLFEQNNRTISDIENREAPTGKMIFDGAKKVKVNSKGLEQNYAGAVTIQVQGGSIDNEWAEGGTFKYFRDKIFATHLQTGYEIGQDKYLEYGAGNKDVLVSMAQEIEKVAAEFVKIREAIILGDGSGALCWIKTQAAGSSTTVFQLVTTGDGTHAKTFGAYYIKPGVQYDLVDPSAATPVQSRVTFSSVDYVNNTATVGSATIALTNGMITNQTILVMPDTYNNVPKGLRYIYAVDKQGYFQNNDLAGDTNRNTPGLNAAGRSISNSLLRLARDRAIIRREEKPSFKMMLSVAQMALLEAKAEGLFRFAAGTKTYDTSVDDARYKEFTFEVAKHFDADLALGCNLADNVVVERMSIGPIKGPDGELFHIAYGANGRPRGKFHMAYGSYDGMGSETPQNGIQIFNLSHAGGVTLANYRETGLGGL
jgi:hypothetical protein